MVSNAKRALARCSDVSDEDDAPLRVRVGKMFEEDISGAFISRWSLLGVNILSVGELAAALKSEINFCKGDTGRGETVAGDDFLVGCLSVSSTLGGGSLIVSSVGIG
mmetsp:Transcript_9146/g.14105  ORF Transcript_9146/g.14105 Transcript_9146/m.14105 type:complete len:107 (-) Transcript_9146:1000-1320(-)